MESRILCLPGNIVLWNLNKFYYFESFPDASISSIRASVYLLSVPGGCDPVS